MSIAPDLVTEPPPADQPPVILQYMQRPAKPRVWPTYLAFPLVLATVLAVGFVFAIVLQAVAMAHTGKPLSGAEINEVIFTPLVLFALTGVTVAIAGFGALLAGALSPQRLQARLALVRTRTPKLTVLILTPGLLGVGMSTALIIQMFWKAESPSARLLGAARDSGPLEWIVGFVIIGLFGPLMEELLFRGYIQTRLIARHGALVGILITSVAFGLWHMNPLHSFQTFFMGLYLGLLAWRCQSLWPAVLAHMFNNAFIYLSPSLLPHEEHVGWLVFASAATFALGSFYLLWRIPALTPPAPSAASSTAGPLATSSASPTPQIP